MTKHYILFLFTILISGTTSAQCVLTNTGATGCTIVDGVLSGTVEVDDDNVILPNFGITTLGSVTFDMQNQSNLILNDGLLIQNGATLGISGTQGNITINAGGVEYRATGGGPLFTDLATELNDCAANPSCTSILGALPVELVSWSARSSGEDVQLNWSSRSESDNDFYEIEHSLDGRTFTKLAIIPGSLQSDELVNYNYMHREAGSGTHFYRLSQQDMDGSRTTFHVLSVSRSSKGSASAVYPNPVVAGTALQLEVNDQQARTASLLDLTGKEVTQFSLNQEGTTRFVVPATLASGVYLLKYGEQGVRIVVR